MADHHPGEFDKNGVQTAARFDELINVRLLRDFESDGHRIRKGRVGTIVHRYDQADAYEVEFARPVGTLLTVNGSDIAACAP